MYVKVKTLLAALSLHFALHYVPQVQFYFAIQVCRHVVEETETVFLWANGAVSYALFPRRSAPAVESPIEAKPEFLGPLLIDQCSA